MNPDISEVYSIKIYFISPFTLLESFLNKLIELEYEVYAVAEEDKEKLLKLLDNAVCNVVFICIHRSDDVIPLIQYLEKLKGLKGTSLRIGVFIRDEIEYRIKNLFLYDNIPVISESLMSSDPLKAFKMLLHVFEAKGQRKHVRAGAEGVCEAYFSFKLENKNLNVVAKIIDISSQAFSCRIEPGDQLYFVPGEYCNNVILLLRGVRIPVAVKIIGYSEHDPDVFVCKVYDLEIKEQRFHYTRLRKEKRKKIFNFIIFSLRTEFKKQLESASAG
jgi:hypothetical protein